jgi:hypothetical protein
LDEPGFPWYIGGPVERDEELEESGLVEIRVNVSAADNQRLLEIRRALKRVISKKAVTELVIAYGVENPEMMLTWYGKRAAAEAGKIKDDG